MFRVKPHSFCLNDDTLKDLLVAPLFEFFRACFSTEGIGDAPVQYVKLTRLPYVGYSRRMGYSKIKIRACIPYSQAYDGSSALGLFYPTIFSSSINISVEIGYRTLACSRRFQLLSPVPQGANAP